MDLFLLCFFAGLDLFALLGLKFQKKAAKSTAKIYRHCPCKKMADNGSLSTLCMYAAMGGFLYSGYALSFVGLGDWVLDGLFLLVLVCGYLGWNLKRE
ncbi:hypothetical protein [Campylobacter sp.]|uniref:hypothetical protein n=1 Tax=Campylobacter sp. TaxID=205 RepID=UPI0026DDAE55|nr:hypothetical protein [Campylobacter sp.]MDO4673976.1 hypothetical protein [Campylobacter sp.]